jgi:eukaryotic-like serine/threonine-protein kinase
VPFTIVGFLFGQSLATNQGADQQQATQVGLIGSVLGVTPVGLIVTNELARRAGEDAAAAGRQAQPPATLVPVPDVTGDSADDAADDLRANGLTATQTQVTSKDTAIGVVASQNPQGGQVVATGSTVQLFVSKGTIVPNVVGLAPDAATERLQRSGLTLRSEEAPSATVPEGEVAGQDPAAGQSVDPGTEVTIFVSTGAGVDVPRVLGLTLDQARRVLVDVGLLIAEDEAISSPAARDVVVFQVPSPGTTVEEGSVVEVRASTGPPVQAGAARPGAARPSASRTR